MFSLLDNAHFEKFSTANGGALIYSHFDKKVHRYSFPIMHGLAIQMHNKSLLAVSDSEFQSMLERNNNVTDLSYDEAKQIHESTLIERAAEECKAALIKRYRASYENACDCLYYGCSRKSWLFDKKMTLAQQDIIWKEAFRRLAEGHRY